MDPLYYGRMDRVLIQTFDGFRATLSDARPLNLSSKAAREVIVYMLLRRNGAITRSQLAGVLWPDVPEQRALKRLSQALWRLNTDLQQYDIGSPLIADRHQVEVAPNHEWVLDVCEFDQLIQRGMNSSGHVALAALNRAAAVNRGVMLPGHDADWIDVERRGREKSLLDALRRLADSHRAAGSPADALVHVRRLASLDPFAEEPQRLVMELLIELGRPHEALGWFDGYRELLERELDGDPEPATVELADRARQLITTPPSAAASIVLPFVGREAERSLLLDKLETLGETGLQVVLVSGTAGVGKSRLLTEFTTDAEWRSAVVLSSRAAADPEPFGLVAKAINPALAADHLETVRAALDPAWLARAGRVLASLDSVEPAVRAQQLTASDQRDQTAEAVVEVVAALAASGRVLLALDDVHRADPDSLFLLERLVTAGRDLPLMVCVAFRPADAGTDPAVQRTLSELRGQRASTEIELGPLDRHAVSSLVRSAVPGASAELAAEVMATTGGVPLSVVQALAPVNQAGGQLAAADLMAIYSNLDEDAQQLALELAVLSDPVDLATLHAVSELNEGRVSQALDRLLQKQLILVEADRYRLNHDSTQESIYTGTAHELAVKAHANAAAGLRKTNAPDAQIARHLAAAGDASGAFGAYRAAARQSLDRNAYEGAGRWYRQAAALVDAAAVPAAEAFELLLEWDDVLSWVGPQTTREALLNRLAKLQPDRPDAAAQVMYRRADHALLLDDYPTAVTQASHAAQHAHNVGNRRLEAMSLTLHGRALHESGAHAEAEPVMQKAATQAPDPRTESEARRALGRLLIDEARYRDAEQHLTKALYLCRAIQDPVGEAAVCNALGTAMILIGDSAQASSYFEDAIEIARAVGVLSIEAFALGNSGLQHYYEGRPRSAVQQTTLAADRCQRLARSNQEARLRANVGHIQVVMLGDYETGSQQLHATMEMFDLMEHPVGRADCLNALARAALRTNDIELARTQATDALEIARQAGVRFVEVQAMRTLAAVEREAGNTGRAIDLLNQGLAICDANELTAVGVLMRGLLGRALLDQGETHQALTELRAATAANRGTVEEAHLVDLWHFEAAAAAGLDDEADAALLRGHHKLESIDEDVGDAWPQVIKRVPAYAAITAAFESRLGRKTMFSVRSGRDQLQVPVVTSPVSSEASGRREAILSVFEQLKVVGAPPSVAELADFFGVSGRTIKRDLADLRNSGNELETRRADSNGAS